VGQGWGTFAWGSGGWGLGTVDGPIKSPINVAGATATPTVLFTVTSYPKVNFGLPTSYPTVVIEQVSIND